MGGTAIGASDVVALVARRLAADEQALSADVCAHLVDQIPELQGDDAIRELLASSVSSNVSTVLHMLAHAIPPSSTEVPVAAAAYARRLAQRDVPVEALLRAYRLGQARFVARCLRELRAEPHDSAELLATMDALNSIAAAYIDAVSGRLVEVYEDERRHWGQKADAARGLQVRAVLEDEELDVAAAEAMIAHRLRGWHVGVVAWIDAAGPEPEALDRAARALTDAAQARPLAVLADDHTLWAWVSGDVAAPLDEQRLDQALTSACASLRVAFGEPARGLDGFRSSHREALQAKRVAEAAAAAAPRVTPFARVSLPAFLAGDLDGVRNWVARTLGDLARDDDAMATLRETVRVFLETGGSYMQAAARLHLHKNTVNYRIRKAEEIRGRAMNEDRLDVEVALVACERFGARVLARAAA